MSVVDPVDKKVMSADIDRKLRFYGVVKALGESRMPTNEQIDRFLRYCVQHSPVDPEELSSDGRRLVQDTRDILETARRIVQQKNADELFQNFVWHTRGADLDQVKGEGVDDSGSGSGSSGSGVDKAKAKDDGRQAVQHLRTLLSLVMTNAEVRKLLADFSVIGRDILARTAGKVAETVRPDEERLRQIGDAAPPDQWVSKDGKIAGPNQTPVSIRAYTQLRWCLTWRARCRKLAYREQELPSLNILVKSWALAPRSPRRMVRNRAALKHSTMFSSVRMALLERRGCRHSQL